MSFDPNQGPPNRPRSTPIPDDGSGLSLPPPTAAQFLREAGSEQDGQMGPPQQGFQPHGFQQPGFQQPGFQQPGFQQGVPSQNLPYVPPAQNQWSGASFNGVPFATTTGRGWRVGIILFIVLTTFAGVGFAIWKTNSAINKATSSNNDNSPSISIPPFSVPTFTVPDFTAPTFSVPDFTAPTIPEIVLPTVPGASVPPVTIGPAATTIPGQPPATALPGGVTSLFEGQAARFVVDQFEANFAGEPTQFTQFILFPDYAIATAQDANNPTAVTGALWRDGALTPATVTSDGVTDINTQLFTGADVNWDAVATLVPSAPGVLGIADGTVSHIIVQRSPFDPAMPLTFAVYVTGASQSGYLEAGADGTVIATHV